MRIDKDLVAASATPLVLGILADGELYGYAILKRVGELSGGRMQWTDGMLYPLLHRLERLGYVTSSWGTSEAGRRRKHYAITATGPRGARRAAGSSGPSSRTRCGRSGRRRPGPPPSWRAGPDGRTTTELEAQIDQWRGYVQRRQAISSADVDELEDHLRGQIDDLLATGLDDDEAFLVAVKRMGNLDAVSREFAREHSDRLWKQLVLVPDDAAGTRRRPGASSRS